MAQKLKMYNTSYDNMEQLLKATDQCAELTYAGAMDFKDGIDKQEEYLWDTNGYPLHLFGEK